MADPITDRLSDETVIRSREDGPGRGMEPPYLVVVDGPRKGSRYPLQAGETLIGRGPFSHVLLEDQSVSRRHCMMTREHEAIAVRDLGSKNGTRVNGHPIGEAVTVGHGDLIQAGIYTLRAITRRVSVEEELAPITTPAAPIEEQPIEESAETAAISREEADAIEEEAAVAEAASEEPPPDDEFAKTMVGEMEPPTRRRRLLFFAIGAGILALVAGGIFAYYRYMAVPSAPTAAGPMVTRVIPAVKPETPPPPSEIPLFVDFASSPMPCKVFFLEKDYGLTPVKVSVNLKPGEQYTAEGHFSLPEFNEERIERVTFTAESEKNLVPVLFRAPIGVFKVEKLPRDVELSLQGFFAYDQFTARNATLSDVSYGKPLYVPYGRYIVELRRPKEIAASGQFVPDIRYRREIFLSEDAPAFHLNITEEELDQFPAEIRSTPSGADVFVDSKPVGKTPFEGTFPLGEHTLILRKEGYFEHSQPLKNDINVLYQLDVPLKTTEAGALLNEGQQLILKGRFKEGVTQLSQVFEKNPTPVETAKAQYLLGTGFLGLADYKTARGYFEQAGHHPEYELQSKLGTVRILTREGERLQALPLIVEVMLRARDETIIAEARETFKEVSPLKSVIYVRSDPPGATVFVNDEPMATKTPLILHDLGLGNYRLRLERADHHPKEINLNLTVHEFNPVIVKLQPVSE